MATREQDGGFTADATFFAARNGHLQVVQWLHSNRQEGCTTRAVDDAAKNGFLDVVKWLLENRSEGYSTDLVAASGRLHVVKWLHNKQKRGVDLGVFNQRDGSRSPKWTPACRKVAA